MRTPGRPRRGDNPNGPASDERMRRRSRDRTNTPADGLEHGLYIDSSHGRVSLIAAGMRGIGVDCSQDDVVAQLRRRRTIAGRAGRTRSRVVGTVSRWVGGTEKSDGTGTK